MSFLKLEYKKMSLSGELPEVLFERVKGPYSSLLSSGKNGRYSYIAYDPFSVIWSVKGIVHALQFKSFFDLKKDGNGRIIEDCDTWVVEDFLNKFDLKGDGPVPFCGGAAGYISYDFGTRFVGVDQKVYDDTLIPGYVFAFYDKVIAFDHKNGELYFLALAETDVAAKRKIIEIEHDLQAELPLVRKGEIGEISSNLSKESYVQKVEFIKELIRKGETYQVNLSQRFSGECNLDSFSIYKKLFDLNPSPFACYFEYPEFSIVSSSPELLFRKRGDRLESWPIKGTIARGWNSVEDNRNVKRLLASKKDDAELSMIVDLVRNDLGVVCEIGSVMVDAHRDIEKYSHVIHTVSRVSGRKNEKISFYDCLKAIFPGGSITGCPKKRTMEIIDLVEDYKRGIYTGSAGFISFSGDSDLNILIRSMLFKDGKVYFHAGGGIVADSDPDLEYDETLDKVEALVKAIE